jgi:hypothetical protein
MSSRTCQIIARGIYGSMKSVLAFSCHFLPQAGEQCYRSSFFLKLKIGCQIVIATPGYVIGTKIGHIRGKRIGWFRYTVSRIRNCHGLCKKRTIRVRWIDSVHYLSLWMLIFFLFSAENFLRVGRIRERAESQLRALRCRSFGGRRPPTGAKGSISGRYYRSIFEDQSVDAEGKQCFYAFEPNENVEELWGLIFLWDCESRESGETGS